MIKIPFFILLAMTLAGCSATYVDERIVPLGVIPADYMPLPPERPLLFCKYTEEKTSTGVNISKVCWS